MQPTVATEKISGIAIGAHEPTIEIQQQTAPARHGRNMAPLGKRNRTSRVKISHYRRSLDHHVQAAIAGAGRNIELPQLVSEIEEARIGAEAVPFHPPLYGDRVQRLEHSCRQLDVAILSIQLQ